MMLKFRQQLKYLKSISTTDLLLYTMGKTGSNSLSYSLEQEGLSVASKHYFGGDQQHFFNDKHNDFLGSVNKAAIRFLLKRTKQRFKVITLVRDPVGRNLSLTFFALDKVLYKTLQVIPNGQADGKYLSLNEIIARGFMDIINQQGPLNWFDQEFNYVLDVDIFQHPFDKKKGYTIIQKEKLDILILKLENLADLEQVIKSFLNLKSFKLLNANAGNRYWYAELYKDFKNYFRPTEAYLNEMYNSKYVTHFYTNAEIAKHRARWNK